MSKHHEESAFEPITASIAPSQEPLLPPLDLDSREATAPSDPTSYEGGANSQLCPWRPTHPQFTKAIAEHYHVSRKTVQEWFHKVKTVCPWFTEADLKTPDGRYTPLCIELMGDYKCSGLTVEAWKTTIWERNPALVQAFLESQTSTLPTPAVSMAEPTPLQIEVMGIEQLQAQQHNQHQVLTLREQTTNALVLANQSRLAQLKDFFAQQDNQRQLDQTQRQAQLEAEAQNEAIEEFLIKQQAKNAVLSQLEQMNTLGKFTPQEHPSPST